MTTPSPSHSDLRSPAANRPAIIAALLTLLIAGLLVLLLLCVKISLSFSVPDTPKANHTLMALDDEEFLDPEDFIDPPVEVADAGEPDPSEIIDDTPAPAPIGEPEPAPMKNDKVSTSAQNPKTNNSAEKLVTQKPESPLKHTNPSPKDQPDQKVASEVGNKFNPHNGTPTGKQTGTSGSSDTGSGAGSAQGYLDGKRKMLSCNNRFPLRISKEIKVIVEVTVDDKGRVTKARCKTPLGDKSLEKKLEQESLGSTWTPKAGAPLAKGTITWTLRPSTK